jgi:ABC-type lipoprotein export system ATPase subunit
VDGTVLGVLFLMAVGSALLVWSLLELRREWHERGGPAPAVPPRPARGAVDTPPQPLFTLRDIFKVYREPSGREVVVLDGLRLDIHEGVTGILGPSGQGKSTLLNLLGGLDVPDEGTISYRGRPLPGREGPGLRAYRAERVSFVFQDCNLISHLTAEENAALPLLCRGVPRGEALRRARRSLALVGLENLAGRRPAQLSGGQRQRVAVARAHTSPAEVILADEPTGALDPTTAEPVMEVFSRLARWSGRPVILVTHNEELARRYCDRLLRWTEHGLEDVTSLPVSRPPLARKNAIEESTCA